MGVCLVAEPFGIGYILVDPADAAVWRLSWREGLQGLNQLLRDPGCEVQHLLRGDRSSVYIHLTQLVVSLSPKMPQLPEEACYFTRLGVLGLIECPQ